MAPLEPITRSALGLDFTPRILQSTAIVGSPATNAETIIASVTIPANASQAAGILLLGFAAFTVGTSGTATNLRIRQTNASGTIIVATGATTGGIAATNLVDMNVQGFDTAGVLPGQVYVLTLQVTGGAAISTVSATQLVAVVI